MSNISTKKVDNTTTSLASNSTNTVHSQSPVTPTGQLLFSLNSFATSIDITLRDKGTNPTCKLKYQNEI